MGALDVAPATVVTVAALYVATGGCYFDLPNVDPWDKRRDARLYDGPHVVVAHPPCERWGRYWQGGPRARRRGALHLKGGDGGCFALALAAVRRWGGVLEHPEASHAWRSSGLIAPVRSGGWFPAGDFLGWTCCVEQGHYGHSARKATWLYLCGARSLPSLKWGPSVATTQIERMSSKRRANTPKEFRDVLLALASTCTGRRP